MQTTTFDVCIYSILGKHRVQGCEYCEKKFVRDFIVALTHWRSTPGPACFLHRSSGLDGVMAKHPPRGHRYWWAWRHPAEGADLDPLGVDSGHGGFEVTELLLLFAVKPALITGLLWRFVVAAVIVRHR